MDWEVYTAPDGYRAELLRGGCSTPLTVIRSRWRPVLYARMALAQWRHR
jgi:hypothetical protein